MNLHDQKVTQINRREDDGTEQLYSLAATVWRGRWRVVMTTLMVVLLAGIYLLGFATPIFHSDVLLVLETREEQVVDLEGVISGLSSDTSVVQTEVEVLGSRGLAQKVVTRLDLASDPEFNPNLRPPTLIDLAVARAQRVIPFIVSSPSAPHSPEQLQAAVVAELLDKLTVQNVGGSLVFRLTVASTSSEKAARIANAFAEAYIFDQLQVKYDATRQATVWLTDRVSDLKFELEEAEAEVKRFQSQTDLIDAENLAVLDRQMKVVRERLDTGRSDLALARTAQIQLEEMKDPIALLDTTGDALLRRLIPEGELNAGQQAAVDARVGQILARARLETDRATNRVDALETSLNMLQRQIDAQSTDLIALGQLVREAEANRLLYEYFLNRLKETSAQQGIQQADSRVLSDAVAPIMPALPRKPLSLAAAGLIGVLAGIALVLSRAATTGFGLRTTPDLEHATGKVVLGEIPRIRVRGRNGFFRYLQTHPVSAAAEALRNLRTSIMMVNPDKPPSIILVTSAMAGEGKTAVAVSLAQKIAELGKKVLLIEADVRQGSLLDYIGGASGGAGLTDVLNGNAEWRETVLRQITPGLDVLPGGKYPRDAPDLFSGDAFGTVTQDALTEYDTIIIDSAPVLLVSEARIIGRLADAILFIVRWDATSRQQVNEGIERFESLGQEVTGLVLSQVDPKGMRQYGYGDNYGGYMAYGSKYFKN
jgi:capsular exopolysaccharide synthesis family protein